MKKLLSVLLVAVMVFALAACSKSGGSDDGGSSDPAVGTWKLTSAEASGITLSMEDFAQLSGLDKYEMTIDIRADGTFTASVDMGTGAQTGEGTWTVSGNQYTLTSNGSPQVFTLENGKLVAEASGAKMYFEK